MVNRARWGKPDLFPKQPQVGCKCKLACKLLELLMRSTTAKDEREVGYSTLEEEDVIWCANWKKKPQRETKVETYLDVLEASLEELYQGQGRFLGVESSQEEAESQIDKVESLIERLTEDTKDSVRHLHEV
ncbi:hypothetical protein GW17_00028053, partial [Ensete ventricosum]